MLKQANTVNTAAEAIEFARGFLQRIPFIQVHGIERQERRDVSKSVPDFVAYLRVAGEPWQIIGEFKRDGYPKQVRGAVFQLKDYLSRTPSRTKYGLVMAPFISEQSAKICRDSGIGFLDLSGNSWLCFDHVFIDTATDKNAFRTQRHLHSIFSPRAGRVLRVLLSPPLRLWKVKDLKQAADVSLGLVSNVRKLLLEHEWASATEAGVAIKKPEELLRAWQQQYRRRSRNRKTFYTPLHGDTLEKATRAALVEAGEGQHAILASFSAARWLAPYARQATNFFYADPAGTNALKAHLKLDFVTKGENVMIEEPLDNDVFLGSIQAAPRIWCTSLVQTYLDLSLVGERGEEAAEHLLKTKLLPGWKQTT